MTREELKTMFLQMDCSKIPVRKEIIVDLRYLDNEWWPNYGYVEIVSDGPDGYSGFSTHEENPLQYALNRIEESKKDNYGGKDLSEYKLIIKK